MVIETILLITTKGETNDGKDSVVRDFGGSNLGK
jgi:hypothetical protein